MRILNNYQINNRNNQYCAPKPAFRGKSVAMTTADLAKLPDAVRTRILSQYLGLLVGEMDKPSQEALAGVLPHIIDPLNNVCALVQRKAKGLPPSVAAFLKDIGVELACVAKKMETAEGFLPKLKSPEIPVQPDVKTVLATLIAKRSKQYGVLSQILSDKACTVKSVRDILNENLLRPIKVDHRFELVEKMLEVAVRRKSPDLVSELFNYTFIREKGHYYTTGLSIDTTKIGHKVKPLTTFERFFNVAVATRNEEVVSDCYAGYMEYSSPFNRQLNNSAIDFALSTTDEAFMGDIFKNTYRYLDKAKFDSEKMAELLEKYLCIHLDALKSYSYNSDDVKAEVTLLFKLPPNLRGRTKVNVITHLDKTETEGYRLAHKKEYLERYFAKQKK